jgi:hypothetical protein
MAWYRRDKEVAQEKGFSMAKLQRAADINLKTIQAIWHNPQHDASPLLLCQR